MAAFRTELRRRREQELLSYADAARIAGITPERWSSIERGYEVKNGMRIPANPRPGTVVKMAGAVSWSSREALESAGMPVPARKADRPDPRTELTDLLASMSEQRVRALLYVALTMRDPLAPIPGWDPPAEPSGDNPDQVAIMEVEPGRAAKRRARERDRKTDPGG